MKVCIEVVFSLRKSEVDAFVRKLIYAVREKS